jgi:hypothetical protein
MYEINIKANSVGELVGRIRALAAEFGAFGGVAVPADRRGGGAVRGRAQRLPAPRHPQGA